MKVEDMVIEIGGLMRCCIATLDRHKNNGIELHHGDKLRCIYEVDNPDPTMIVDHNHIRWIGANKESTP